MKVGDLVYIRKSLVLEAATGWIRYAADNKTPFLITGIKQDYPGARDPRGDLTNFILLAPGIPGIDAEGIENRTVYMRGWELAKWGDK